MSKRKSGMQNSLRIKSSSFSRKTDNNFIVKNEGEEIKMNLRKEGFVFRGSPYRYEDVEDMQKMGKKNGEKVKYLIFFDDDVLEFELESKKSENDKNEQIKEFENSFFHNLSATYLIRIQKLKKEVLLHQKQMKEANLVKEKIIRDTEERFVKKFRDEDKKLCINITKPYSKAIIVSGQSSLSPKKKKTQPAISKNRTPNMNFAFSDIEKTIFYEESLDIIDQCIGKFEEVQKHLHVETKKILEEKRDDLLSFQSSQSLAWSTSLKVRQIELLMKEKERKMGELNSRLKSFKKSIVE